MAGIEKSWNSTAAFFERTWLRIRGLFSGDVASDIAKVNEELEKANAAVDSRRNEIIRARDQAAQQSAAESKAGEDANIAAINEDLNRRL